MKNVRAFVIVSALLVVMGSVSSALAFPQRDSDPDCFVRGNSEFTPVFNAPSLMAPIINYLDEWDWFEADGYVIEGGLKFYLIPKHGWDNEWLIGDGYVHEWDATEMTPCGEILPPTIQFPQAIFQLPR